jgi:GxxExxY protein
MFAPESTSGAEQEAPLRDEVAMRQLCDEVRQIAFGLHTYLRHGHLERVYETGLWHRLRKAGYTVERQVPLRVYDEDGTTIGEFFADLLVEDCLIVELKACKALGREHTAQVLGYLRASRRRDALLINFGAPTFQIKKFIL